MAIKFSQFVVQTDASTLSHVVGYNGVDNIQITPTNFLNSLLTGTAGQVLFYDTTGVTSNTAFKWDNTNSRLGIGTNSPVRTLHVATDSGVLIKGASGSANAKISLLPASGGRQYDLGNVGADFRIFDASAGVTRMYFDNDGNTGIGTTTPSAKLEVAGDIKLGDNKILRLGSTSGGDFNLGFDGNNGFASNLKGDLYIQNFANDKDVIFRSDDGSGGVTTYFKLDGATSKTIFETSSRHKDNIKANFGDGEDLRIYHDGTSSSYIQIANGDLYIRNESDADQIYIQASNSSGTLANYLTIDGSAEKTLFSKDIYLNDDVRLRAGTGGDFFIFSRW